MTDQVDTRPRCNRHGDKKPSLCSDRIYLRQEKTEWLHIATATRCLLCDYVFSAGTTQNGKKLGITTDVLKVLLTGTLANVFDMAEINAAKKQCEKHESRDIPF